MPLQLEIEFTGLTTKFEPKTLVVDGQLPCAQQANATHGQRE